MLSPAPPHSPLAQPDDVGLLKATHIAGNDVLGQIGPLGYLSVKTRVMCVRVGVLNFVTLPSLVDDQYQYLELICYLFAASTKEFQSLDLIMGLMVVVLHRGVVYMWPK